MKPVYFLCNDGLLTKNLNQVKTSIACRQLLFLVKLDSHPQAICMPILSIMLRYDKRALSA